MRGHRSSKTAAGILLLLLAGCSTVPGQHVEGYTQAFDEASAAGNRLYDGISAKVTQEQAEADEQAEHRIAAAQTTSGDGTVIEPAAGPGDTSFCLRSVSPLEPYPACFNPTHFAPGHLPGEPDSLVARRRALATITTFNAIALRLASGETADALGSEVQRLGSNASSLATLSGAGAVAAPVIGITTDMAARLARWAETLRADQELRSAINAGGPLIQQLLTALINDTPTMYALKREEVAAQADALTRQAREAAFDIEDIMTTHVARRLRSSPSWRNATSATTTRDSESGWASSPWPPLQVKALNLSADKHWIRSMPKSYSSSRSRISTRNRSRC